MMLNEPQANYIVKLRSEVKPRPVLNISTVCIIEKQQWIQLHQCNGDILIVPPSNIAYVLPNPKSR
jgi:hypothetical protein